MDGRPRRRMRWVLSAFAAVGAGVLLTACDDINTADRPDDPVVLTGADLSGLVGADPGLIVAFSHSRPDATPTWTQIPVQVDERKVVDYGAQPSSNAQVGVTGTIYGAGSSGVAHLQYADAGTFVGADSDPTFDTNDELVFMAADGGGKPREDEESEPGGVVAGSGVKVRYDDPEAEGGTGWMFLFVSDGTLDPAAGADYVIYDFALGTGDYKTTYKRADGPNPETSTVTTASYQIGFSDRWIEDVWRLDSGTGLGPDLLDGLKDRFSLSTCARSNATFQGAEGAFVANIDGPVRAIRSYVGANSGPLTQRTHMMYRTFEETITDLRVHSIPGIMSFVDYGANLAGLGGRYYGSTTPGGVTIDGSGNGESVPATPPTWELVTSAQGSITTTHDFKTSFVADPLSVVDWFYRDDTNSSFEQCWGDAHFIGASGLSVNIAIPNTDPRTSPFGTLATTRFTRFDGAALDVTDAARWATDVGLPLQVTITDYTLTP